MGFLLDLLDQLLHRHVGRAPNAELAEAADQLRGIRRSRAPPSDIGEGRSVRRMSQTFNPLGGKMLTPEQIARTAAFLASEDASAITGQVLHVNGGSYMP